MQKTTNNAKKESSAYCFAIIESSAYCFAIVDQGSKTTAAKRPSVSLGLENLEEALV